VGNAHPDTEPVLAEDRKLARETERLRREVRILKDLSGSENSPVDCFPGRWGHPKKPSSSRAKSRGVQARQGTARGLPARPAVSCDECKPARVAGVPELPSRPETTHRHACSGTHQGEVAAEAAMRCPVGDCRRSPEAPAQG